MSSAIFGSMAPNLLASYQNKNPFTAGATNPAGKTQANLFLPQNNNLAGGGPKPPGAVMPGQLDMIS